MKQLKKISLQKEELMSLNSPQMDAIKGGTSPVYYIYMPTTWVTVGPPIPDDIYAYLSIYGGDDYPDAEYASQYYEEGACMLPPIYVTP